MTRFKLAFLLTFFGMTGVAASASALSFARVAGFDEIVATSSLAFHGEVIDVEYGFVTEAQMPYTETSFLVHEGFVGAEKGDIRVIRQIGGEFVDRQGRTLFTEVHGLPHYRVGVEYVLFSNDRFEPMLGTRYASFGVFRVTEGTFGHRHIMNHMGRPLTRDVDAKLRFSRSLACTGLSDDGRACVQWREESDGASDHGHHAHDDHGRHAHDDHENDEDAVWATLADFTDRIRRIYQAEGALNVDAQTVTATRARFTKAIRRLAPARR
jgi:hypothetical protein